MDPQAQQEWSIVRHFIPTAGGADPIIVSSLAFTDTRGFVATGVLDDGRSWGVQPLLFGRARLGVWRPGLTPENEHDDVWDYTNPVVAVVSVGLWGGDEIEPRWWCRHPASRRRRVYARDGSFEEACDDQG